MRMRGRWAMLFLAVLLAGCLRGGTQATEAVAPPTVEMHATDCALVWMRDAKTVPLARVAPMLPPNATALPGDPGHAIVTLAALSCDASEPAGFAWGWLSARASIEGRGTDVVLEHWANASAWSVALARHGAAVPVDTLDVERTSSGVSFEARTDATRLRLVMPHSRATAAIPASLDLTLDTGSTLALRLDAAPHASSAAFELPAGSRARELLGATGARAAAYAEGAAVEGTLARP